MALRAKESISRRAFVTRHVKGAPWQPPTHLEVAEGRCAAHPAAPARENCTAFRLEQTVANKYMGLLNLHEW
jgi:hypothetical protein